MSNIEKSDSHNLSNLCRVCLSKTDMMSDLFDSSRDLCDLFRIVVNIELERNEIFPNFLCNICEEKILICQEFINQCKKTNELLEKYRIGDIKIEEEETKVFLESENVAEFADLHDDNSIDCKDYKQEFDQTKIPASAPEIVNFMTQDESNGDSKDYKDNVDQSTDENAQKLQLKQFSYEEVMHAIETVKNKSNDIRNCGKCNYRGRNFRSLSLHMSYMHKEIKEKWCPTCNGVFENLNDHSKVHNKKENCCQFCGRGFAERRFLIEHIFTHSKTRPHKCDICGKSFIHIKNLRKHNISHLEEKPFVCNFCGTTFTQKYSLKTHTERFHKDVTEFRCIHCKCKFETEDMLMTHKCTENVTNAFVDKQNFCGICDKKVQSLTLHNRKFHEGKTIEERPVANLCTICGKQIKSYAKFEAHMRVHTGDTPYKCSYCDKKMTRRCLLVAHERTHTGERPYICRICKKDFTQRSSLNTHMKLHSDKQDVCIICGKEFYRIADLRMHLKKHTGEKTFICSFCGKGFAQKCHLVVHVRTHTNDRPFKCDSCHKNFRQQSALKTHIQMHLGEKPFKCSQCPYACRQSSRLTIHMSKHVDDTPQSDRPHSCDQCHKNFSTLAMLNSHISNVHTTTVNN